MTGPRSELYKASIPAIATTLILTSEVKTTKMLSKVVKKISVIMKRRLAAKMNIKKPSGISQEEMENANNEAVEENHRNNCILMKMAS